MNINDALKGVGLVAIDTAPIIYFAERNPQYVGRMRDILRLIDAGIPLALTSMVTLTEVMTQPFRTQNIALQARYRQLLFNTRNIETLPVTEPIATIAAELRAKYNLRTPDALQVATAIQAQCDAFLTNDRTIKRVSEIQVLVLDELT